MNNERVEKFLALTTDETSDFEKKALWRKANKNWLKKSTAIAIKVHSAIKEQNLSQTKLADRMGVSAQYISKILKGNENLSLDTISKLEAHLGIQLIEVVDFSFKNNYAIPVSLPQVNISTWTVTKRIVQPLHSEILYQSTNFEVPAA